MLRVQWLCQASSDLVAMDIADGRLTGPGFVEAIFRGFYWPFLSEPAWRPL